MFCVWMVFAFETYQINDDDFLKVGQFKGKLQFYSLISTSPRMFFILFFQSFVMLLLKYFRWWWSQMKWNICLEPLEWYTFLCVYSLIILFYILFYFIYLMEHQQKFPPVAVCLAELSPSIKQKIPMPMQAKNLLSTNYKLHLFQNGKIKKCKPNGEQKNLFIKNCFIEFL